MRSHSRSRKKDAFADEITQPAPARDPVDELDARLTVDASLTRTRAPSLVARCCARGRSIVVCSVSCADAAAAGVVVRLYVDAHASPLAERRTGLADGRDARKATCVFDAPPTGGVVVASAVDRCVEIKFTARSRPRRRREMTS